MGKEGYHRVTLCGIEKFNDEWLTSIFHNTVTRKQAKKYNDTVSKQRKILFLTVHS